MVQPLPQLHAPPLRLIEIANRSNLTDSFCSGIIQTNGTGLFKTPAYYAQQLYATHAGSRPLEVRIGGELPSDPWLDASATLSEDGRTIALFAVNPTTESQLRTLDLAALAPLEQKRAGLDACRHHGRRRARRRQRLAPSRPHPHRAWQHRAERRKARVPLPSVVANRPENAAKDRRDRVEAGSGD